MLTRGATHGKRDMCHQLDGVFHCTNGEGLQEFPNYVPC